MEERGGRARGEEKEKCKNITRMVFRGAHDWKEGMPGVGGQREAVHGHIDQGRKSRTTLVRNKPGRKGDWRHNSEGRGWDAGEGRGGWRWYSSVGGGLRRATNATKKGKPAGENTWLMVLSFLWEGWVLGGEGGFLLYHRHSSALDIAKNSNSKLSFYRGSEGGGHRPQPDPLTG